MVFLFLLPLTQCLAPQGTFLTIWAIDRMGYKSTHNFPTLLLFLSRKDSVGGKQQRTLDVMQKAIALHKIRGPYRIESQKLVWIRKMRSFH